MEARGLKAQHRAWVEASASRGRGTPAWPVLTCTHMGSYLTLPAVHLETLKAELQDDGPASVTFLRGRELLGGRRYLPGPAQPSPASTPVTTGWSAISTPPARGLSPGQRTPQEPGKWFPADHPAARAIAGQSQPHVPPMAATHGAQITNAQGKRVPGHKKHGSTSLGVVLGPTFPNGFDPAPP